MRTIVWDVDDTLNDLMRVWLEEYFLPRNRGVKARYAGITDNPPHRLLGVTLAKYQRSLDAFRLSGKYAALTPSPAALRWFRAHGQKYRHVALTAVPLAAAHESAAWVFRNFGRWIRTFHVVPTRRKDFRAPDYDAHKADFIKRLERCDCFVDDSPANLAPAEKLGVKCILVPRPWNGGVGSPEGIFSKI